MKTVRFIGIICFAAVVTLSSAAHAGRVSVVGKLTHSFTVTPGQVLGGRIDLRADAEGGSVRVYQTDYMFQADGSNQYGTPGEEERSNAAWISFSPTRVRVPGGQTDAINYEIAVPDDPDLRGSYWSLMMVEIIPDSSRLLDDEDDRPQVQLTTVFRYGIQIVTTIGGGDASIQFVRRELVRTDDDCLQLQIDAANDGEIWLNLDLWAELFDEEGRSRGRFEGNAQRIYPGCSAAFRVNLGELDPGRYSALVVADNGDENVFGAQYDLDVE